MNSVEIFKTDGLIIKTKRICEDEDIADYLKAKISSTSKLLLALVDCYPYKLTFENIIDNQIIKKNDLEASLKELLENGFASNVIIKKDKIEKEFYFLSCDCVLDLEVPNMELKKYTDNGYEIIKIVVSKNV